jgi:hypothetical protein
VVVKQKAQWCSADTGQATGSRTMASVFIVRDGWVMRVVRYPDLANAVHAASFDGSYRTRQPSSGNASKGRHGVEFSYIVNRAMRLAPNCLQGRCEPA